MRFSEICESYTDELNSDVNGLLMKAIHDGQNQVNTADLARLLVGMGYSLDVDSLSELLNGNPLVLSVTPTVITLGTEEPKDEESESKDAVSKMARKEADRSIRS